MIRVYIAEDSSTVMRLFQLMLEQATDMVLVGQAGDGEKAKQDLEILKPDILVTDLWMPRMDGYELISWAMANQPLPILVLSDAVDRLGQQAILKCLALGALEARPKPRAGSPEQFIQSQMEFLYLIRVLSGVRPVRRWNRELRPGDILTQDEPAAKIPTSPSLVSEIVAIGASTGGPQVIQGLLAKLPRNYSLPILLALHIEPGFMHGLADWLSSITPLRVNFGEASGRPEPGTLYLTREGHHLVVTPDGAIGYARPLPFESLIPSVDWLFASVAEAYGSGGCGILLTGMGRDGATGLKAIRAARGKTIAQEASSCTVYGMPKVAVEMGAVEQSMDPSQMVQELLRMGEIARGSRR